MVRAFKKAISSPHEYWTVTDSDIIGNYFLELNLEVKCIETYEPIFVTKNGSGLRRLEPPKLSSE